MKFESFRLRFLALACLALLSVSALAAKPPEEWDGLKLVKLKGLDAAYARPGADFTIYTKIIIDPIQVAFAKDWDKKSTVYKQKLSQKELDNIKTKLGQLAEETFKEEFSKKNGMQIVTEP